MPNLQPRTTPCGSCPYRRDCPSGIWDQSEYDKLKQYDAETFAQPPGVFMCHDKRDDVTLCRGWLDTHPKDQSLALRLAVSIGEAEEAIFDLPPSGVPVFESGAAAAAHGMKGIRRPSVKAIKMISKLQRKIRVEKPPRKRRKNDKPPR